MSHRATRRAITLLEVLLVIAIIGVLLGLLLPAVQKVRSAAQRVHCANNLKQIGLGLLQYHDAYERFPPSVVMGESDFAFLSWRARILPFIGQEALWQQVVADYAYMPPDAQGVPWYDDPPQVGFFAVVPTFACPADSRTSQPTTFEGVPVLYTSYAGVNGVNFSTLDGILFYNSRVRIADITDGTSNTIMVGERPNAWSWYADTGQGFYSGSPPMDIGAREVNGYPPWETDWSDGPYNCLYGPYHFKPGRMDNGCDQLHFWSLHAGGANFLFADGAVRFLSYSADAILPALATRNGQERIDGSDY
jgi:prepilin-type processing-associated H-X9-DG protein/prepilin-type N-terminal cleavage/methylation domain-containing protein